MRRTAVLALPLALLACVPAGPAPPGASLPPGAVQGAGDPARGAILSTAYVFGTPSSVAGRPDAAATAVAQLEYLAVEIPTGARWAYFSPTVGLALRDARSEARAALGIAPGAPPQAVIDALYASAASLRAGDRAAAARALSPVVAPAGGDAVLARLAALPPLPRAAAATAQAERELIRTDREGRDLLLPGR